MVHFGLVLGLALAVQKGQAAKMAVREYQLTVKFTNDGSKLCVASYGATEPIEPNERLILHTTTKTVAIHGLGDLEGYVHIDSASAALSYVRLRTSPATWYLWHDRQLVEIVDNAMANKLPTYGLASEGKNRAHSGFMGILSSTAFKQGGFVAAGVTITAQGFVVKRWLLGISGEKNTVELVQETVGKTGAFKRVVLQSKTAPQLRDTNWYIMKFE